MARLNAREQHLNNTSYSQHDVLLSNASVWQQGKEDLNWSWEQKLEASDNPVGCGGEKRYLEVERPSFLSGSDIDWLVGLKQYTKHFRILIPHLKWKVMNFLLLSTCGFLYQMKIHIWIILFRAASVHQNWNHCSKMITEKEPCKTGSQSCRGPWDKTGMESDLLLTTFLTVTCRKPQMSHL